MRTTDADPRRAVLRILVGGGIAMTVTYGIGQLLGVAGD
jgi:vacuolar iron transporter family protein